MDSLTQIVLGASIAGFCAPSGQRRKALLVGAVLGTLPDLDALIDYGDPVSNMTYHRGFSHSLLVLAPFSLLLWLLLRQWWAPVRESPGRWLAAISLTLLTHPLLDAHTVYGTQLLWPLTSPPVMWSTVFIIDPLYTLPLLVAVVVAWLRPLQVHTGRWLLIGLILSSTYLGWTWAAKALVERAAAPTLAQLQLHDAAKFSVPTPFNTLLWRVVVLTDDGYLEGFYSLLADRGPMRFQRYLSDTKALAAAADLPAVKRLRWFANDFLKSQVIDQQLVLSDLRMGQEPGYIFIHAVARHGNPHWKPLDPPQRLPASVDARGLPLVWRRIWQAPP